MDPRFATRIFFAKKYKERNPEESFPGKISDFDVLGVPIRVQTVRHSLYILLLGPNYLPKSYYGQGIKFNEAGKRPPKDKRELVPGPGAYDVVHRLLWWYA